MAAPCIKGSVIGALIEDVRKIRDEGGASQARLERFLRPDDFELLDEEISPAKWYPIQSYRRLTECLLEIQGGGRPEYLEERGARSARNVIAAGVYQQLDHLTRDETGGAEGAYRKFSPEQKVREFGRQVRLISTLSGTIFNFGKWRVEPDPEHDDRFRIEIQQAQDFPEVLIPTIAGFFNAMSDHSNQVENLRWTGTRERPDLVVFRMDRGVTEALPY